MSTFFVRIYAHFIDNLSFCRLSLLFLNTLLFILFNNYTANLIIIYKK